MPPAVAKASNGSPRPRATFPKVGSMRRGECERLRHDAVRQDDSHAWPMGSGGKPGLHERIDNDISRSPAELHPLPGRSCSLMIMYRTLASGVVAQYRHFTAVTRPPRAMAVMMPPASSLHSNIDSTGYVRPGEAQRCPG